MKKILIHPAHPLTALLLIILMILAAQGSYAQSVPVVQDNGSGNQYDILPVNYVHITDMDFAHAVIESGSGYALQKGYVGVNDQYRTNLVWTGKLKFGSSNTTNDKAASLHQNGLPDVTLRFPGGARLSDGTVCDIRMTLSEVRVNLGASRTNKITDNTTLQVVIAGGWGCLSAMPPRTSHAVRGATAANGNNAGCTVGSRYKITIQIVNKGTNTPVSAEYPSMLVEFKDLDVLDKTVKKSAGAAAKGNGTYAEGIELVSGWTGSAVLAPATSDMANTVLVNAQTTSAGNTKIKVNGAAIQSFTDKFNPTSGDYDTLWSGFVAAVKPQGFSFYWTGSAIGGTNSSAGMGTVIGGQPTVAVKARRNNPGASGANLGGDGTFSGVDSWHTNTHLMNSSAVYSYSPAPGWLISDLKVDGESLELTDEQKKSGGSYTFERLNKYPLPQRDIRNGQVLIARESGFYTIEASYVHLPEYTDTKTSDTAYIRTYDDKEITYCIRCEEMHEDAAGGEHVIHDDMAGGLLILSGEPEVTVSGGRYIKNKADSTGLDYTFISDEANGTRPYMTITYKARVNWEAYFASEAVSIVNRCGDSTTETEVMSSLRITKTVSGKLRDTTKAFCFEVSLSGLEPGKTYAAGSGQEFGTGGGARITRAETGTLADSGIQADEEGNAVFDAEIKGGQGIGILDIPVGAKYRVSEEANDHRPSYRLEADSESPVFAKQENRCGTNNTSLSTEEETLDKQDGIVTVAFDNNREPATITGIMMHGGELPVLAGLMAIASAYILAAAVRRRKEAKDGYRE